MHETLMLSVFGGSMLYVLLAKADADVTGGWFDAVNKYGFTTVFAVVMLALLVYALKQAAQFAKDRFKALENRCTAMDMRLDELQGEDRQRLEALVERNTASQQEVSSSLGALTTSLMERPCQLRRPDGVSGGR